MITAKQQKGQKNNQFNGLIVKYYYNALEKPKKVWYTSGESGTFTYEHNAYDVVSVTPMALTDKYLCAYRDNNPVVREGWI